MTIGELLQQKGLSRYRLSKESGVPWATLSDICSGKTKFERCNVVTLSKLSKALGITMEELLLLETGNDMNILGKPQNRNYLEKGLLESLQKALDEYIQGEKDQRMRNYEILYHCNSSAGYGKILTDAVKYLVRCGSIPENRSFQMKNLMKM